MIHHVICGTKTCRKPLALYNYWRKPICPECRANAHGKRERLSAARARVQARRYRILLHVAGYTEDQFAEFLEELKKSPLGFRTEPETRLARLDATLERKARRRVQHPRSAAVA